MFRLPQFAPQPLLHLVRGLLRERERQDPVDRDLLDEDLLLDLRDEERGLAGAGAGGDGEAPVGRDRPVALGLIGRRRSLPHSTSSSAAGTSSASSARTTEGQWDFRQTVRKSQYPHSRLGRMTNSPRAIRSRYLLR